MVTVYRAYGLRVVIYVDDHGTNGTLPRRREVSETYRITVDPGRCGGRPCLRGLRIACST